jgi:tRNA (guanine37-N1)-methyltransferase
VGFSVVVKLKIVTLFPAIVQLYFEMSIMARAVKRGIIEYTLVNIRDYTCDKHKTCDDTPYGGGVGMVILPEPLGCALDSIDALHKYVVYVTPSGIPFTQDKALELSREKEIVFICGRYEGVDQRIIDRYVDDEVSIGDYVLSSGELASLVIIDTVYRLIDGVISTESLDEESFSDGLLEYPQYTRPEEYRGMNIPDILLSGHHKHIQQWRLAQRIAKTLAVHPDLLERAQKK